MRPLLTHGVEIALRVALRIAWVGMCAIGSATSTMHAVGARVDEWLESD